MNRPDLWMLDAACCGQPTELFFPDAPDALPPEVVPICRECLVRDECLAYALADPDLAGIWAGTTERRRRRMRRRLRDPLKEVSGW